MLTVGRLARKHGLSRSTLLYYDRIGLLVPGGRAKGEYRRYTAEDEARLVRIRRLRAAGLPLADIRRLLDAGDAGSEASGETARVLERRFDELERELAGLRTQQRLIADLLRNPELLERSRPLDKDGWTGLLAASGFSEEDMRAWHQAFEATDPARHRRFLEHLGLPPGEAALIQCWAAPDRNEAAGGEPGPAYMDAMYACFEGMARQAPGGREHTARALAAIMEGLPEAPRVLDLGCGTGAQTLDLLELLPGAMVTAVDLHPPSLETLRARAEERGTADRLKARAMDMAVPDLPAGSFDLLWSEGAAYAVGLEHALTAWRGLLRPGGCLSLSELCWFTDAPHPEARAFWAREYPDMRSPDAVAELARRAGWSVQQRFRLPPSAWWEGVYDELAERLPGLRRRFAEDPDALAAVTANEAEVELFRRHNADYGFVFFVLRRG